MNGLPITFSLSRADQNTGGALLEYPRTLKGTEFLETRRYDATTTTTTTTAVLS